VLHPEIIFTGLYPEFSLLKHPIFMSNRPDQKAIYSLFSKSGCKSTTNFGQTQNLLGFLQILPWKTTYLNLLLTIKAQLRVLNT